MLYKLVRKNGKGILGMPKPDGKWFERSNGDLDLIEEGDMVLRIVTMPEAMKLLDEGGAVYVEWVGSIQKIDRQTTEPLMTESLFRGTWYSAA